MPVKKEAKNKQKSRWIMMRVNLREDPAVIGVSRVLGIPVEHVVGLLHALWSWANEQLRDGNADSVTSQWIDRHVAHEGFAQALEKQGWLRVTEKGIIIPDFDEWNSAAAKKRGLGAVRTAKCRARGASPVSRKRNAAGVTKTSPEKRREEKSIYTPPSPPKGGAPNRSCASFGADGPLGSKGLVFLDSKFEEGKGRWVHWSSPTVGERGVSLGGTLKTGVPQALRERWEAAYPACGIDAELARALAWCMEQLDGKGRKSNYGLFLAKWMSRTQDKGGTRGGTVDDGKPPALAEGWGDE